MTGDNSYLLTYTHYLSSTLTFPSPIGPWKVFQHFLSFSHLSIASFYHCII